MRCPYCGSSHNEPLCICSHVLICKDCNGSWEPGVTHLRIALVALLIGVAVIAVLGLTTGYPTS